MAKQTWLDERDTTIAWGLLLLWWGLRWWPLHSLPEGSTLLGTGIILLGITALRQLHGLTTSHFTIWAGIIALVWGLVELANVIFRLPFKLPVFELLLIVAGAGLLLKILLQSQKGVEA